MEEAKSPSQIVCDANGNVVESEAGKPSDTFIGVAASELAKHHELESLSPGREDGSPLMNTEIGEKRTPNQQQTMKHSAETLGNSKTPRLTGRPSMIPRLAKTPAANKSFAVPGGTDEVGRTANSAPRLQLNSKMANLTSGGPKLPFKTAATVVEKWGVAAKLARARTPGGASDVEKKRNGISPNPAAKVPRSDKMSLPAGKKSDAAGL